MGYIVKETSPTNLHERVKKLLVSYEFSDCSFSVLGQNLKAHKLLLGISSPVFEAMFYGPLSSNEDIVITDIEPDTFQLLLNYIYTDQVEISSIDQAFELLYASRKYLLDHLSNLCIVYIQANISVDNVVDILNYPDHLQDPKLASFAMKLFCEHASFLLEEFIEYISFSCMKNILSSNDINIKEVDLIKNLFVWTKYYCKQNNIPDSFENRNAVLFKKGLFKLLRFHTLSLNEFEEIQNAATNLLLPQDLEYIKKKILDEQDIENRSLIPAVNVQVSPRRPLNLQWYFCKRIPLTSAAPLIIDINNYTLHCRLKTNKSIFINSLSIPTRMAPVLNFHTIIPKRYSEQLSVTIISESDNTIIKYINFMNTVEYDSNVDIELNEPCFIKQNKWYKISFIWPKNMFDPYSYVVELRNSVYNGYRTKIEFDDSTAGTDGNFLEGLKFCL
ncbi:unnamed protein product [Diatraea saccharalis]|uniref:BTB domain-containing protein n=1 Tax=Diatraea saccharalis TaxID=40085 RepID=A0A9N9WA94_9NEOP|nr:unnamed protein product [Diatraea saccharalis]